MNDVSDEIDRFLKIAAKSDSGLTDVQSISISFLLLNGLWERIQEVLKILSVPESYIARHFEAFKRVRRWANFFKHPKEFGWRVHHPQYRIGVGPSAIPEGHLIANDEFIKKHFSAEANSGLSTALRGFERKVIVDVPSPFEIIQSVCTSAQVFVDLVTMNPVYVEVLKDRATIANYFTTLEPQGEV